MNRRSQRAAVGAIYLLATFLADMGIAAAGPSYSPYVGQNYPRTAFWGDTHLHTNHSIDAYYFGDRLDLDEAYRLAQGETVKASNGMAVKLRRPLDFLVVADHAESIGLFCALEGEDPQLLATDIGKQLLQKFDVQKSASPVSLEAWSGLSPVMGVVWSRNTPPQWDKKFEASIWRRVAEAADRHNIPGRFTAFIGFEWTSELMRSGNQHRVVIFKDDSRKATQTMPFSAFQSEDPEALWEYMADYERRTGGKILAIPHNGNLSNGKMFSLQDFSGRPLARSYAERRARWEPLYEVTQIKGTSEAHPFLSPTDEFADYEIWSSWSATELPAGRHWDDTERILKEGEYARSALKRGLLLETQIGANPFKFGLIGGTDSHTSLAAVEEDNFWGKSPATGPGPDRIAANKLSALLPIGALTTLGRRPESDIKDRAWNLSASGYAAVWATENTRDALFAAMQRRETYATTGPRMLVRFFGGWNFVVGDAAAHDVAAVGYKKGVPMGGEITNQPSGRSPSFLIRAVKDSEGANLDRVQVIKGWVDKSGSTQEKIYDVALSDGRKTDAHGKAPRVGSTVDVQNATYTNSIGAPEMAVVWTDPEFDPALPAFYYVRVLEIPTPRWTAYDAKFFGVKDVPREIPMTQQERAYTSPIWYAPSR